MSAFVVEDKTINRVITFLATDREGDWIRREIRDQLGIELGTEIGRKTLGNLMFSLNCDAVNQRYGENEAKEFRPLNYQYVPEYMCNRIQAYKSLQCWHYQCSEGDIDQNKLYQVMERVQGYMAGMIVDRMDAYGHAEWA